MALPITNKFTSYDITEEELHRGQILTESQRQVLQTKLSMYAEMKVAICYDPINPNVSLQREAELTGQIGTLEEILQNSIDSKEFLEQEIRDRK